MSEVFTRLSDLFPSEEYEADAPTQAKRLLRRQAAYKALFAGKGTVADADIVLIDLLQVTGYHSVAEPVEGQEHVSDQVLREAHGMRKIGAHVMAQLNQPRAVLEKLQEIALSEPAQEE